MENKLIYANELQLKNVKEDFFNFVDVSEVTRKSYNMGIKSFIDYLYGNDIKEPTREDVIRYRDILKETHSVATVNSYLIALRQFYSYLEYNGICKNITVNVKSLKDTNIHKKKSLSISQCGEMINACDNLMDKVLFTLTLNCGLRANELVNIQLKDFETSNGKTILYVLGKGRDYKQDYVIVSEKVYSLIKEYVKEYKINDYLFVSNSNHNKNGKLCTNTIRRHINNLFEKTGIKEDKITLHSIRHSFATISIENGADIRQVSTALRHSSTAITERYLHDLDMINNKCSDIIEDVALGGLI